jgi:3-methyl-2-oxobutanoate hydroxymethyltransferase
MIHHCKAVMRAQPSVPVIVDMPYGSFHVSPEETVRHALRLVKEGGASAVKIEGGRRREDAIRALLAAEIPVMGHLGLTPQSINQLGGYKVQGKGKGAAERLIDEAVFLEEIGCFSMVLECVPAPLAEAVSKQLTIPTIGIGAGPGCDGQVLVFHDLLGLFDGVRPRFVKRYAELGQDAANAIGRFADDVRTGVFPAEEHCFFDEAKPEATTTETAAKGYLANLESGGEE